MDLPVAQVLEIRLLLVPVLALLSGKICAVQLLPGKFRRNLQLHREMLTRLHKLSSRIPCPAEVA